MLFRSVSAYKFTQVKCRETTFAFSALNVSKSPRVALSSSSPVISSGIIGSLLKSRLTGRRSSFLRLESDRSPKRSLRGLKVEEFFLSPEKRLFDTGFSPSRRSRSGLAGLSDLGLSDLGLSDLGLLERELPEEFD